MSWIWEHSAASGSELLILLAMADFADDTGGSIYPSMQTLAKKARMSTDQARRVVHKLIADGLVELVQKGGWDGGRNRSNEYCLILDRTCTVQVPRTRKKQAPSTDASTVLAPVQDDPSYNHHIEPPLTEDVATQHTPQQEMFGAICEAIGWDYNTLSKGDRGQVAQAVGILVKANYTVDDIRRFMTDFWFKDWRWEKDGKPPTLKQLRQEIGIIRSNLSASAPPPKRKGVDGYREMLAEQGIDL